MVAPRMAIAAVVGWLAVMPAAGEEPGTEARSPAATSAPAGRTVPSDDPWSSPEVAAPRFEDQPLRRPNAARGDGPRRETGRAGSAWLRTSASLAGVVGLIVLLAWGYRAVSSAGGVAASLRARQPGLIELISRASLAPRQSLYLVRVGPQFVLIGATPGALRTLSVIDDPDWAARLAGQHAARKQDSHVAEFQRCLAAQADAYGDDVDEASAADARAVPALSALGQRLARTVRRWQARVKSA